MSKEILTHQLPPVRITKEEKDALIELAEDDNRTLSNYIRTVLVKHINRIEDMSGKRNVGEMEAIFATKKEPKPETKPVSNISGWTNGAKSVDEPKY